MMINLRGQHQLSAWSTAVLRRLPKQEEYAPVFSVIVVILFSWSIIVFFSKVPSWLFFLRPEELLIILAYTFSLNFIASMMFLGLLCAVCLILPERYFRDDFAVKGSYVSLISLLSVAIYVYMYPQFVAVSTMVHALWFWGTVILSAVLAFLSRRIPQLGRAMIWTIDRLVIFLYLFVPLSLVSLGIVVVRNIF